MGGHRGVFIFVAILSSLVATCYGGGLFSKLDHTLTVSTSPAGNVYRTPGGQISVTWGLNTTTTAGDAKTAKYKNVEVKLCYLPESQEDRPWRKTVDDLDRDKTCQFTVAEKVFSTSSNDTVTYTVKKDVPSAHYFFRAYVLDGPGGNPVAYGETDGVDLRVKGISGRSPAVDIAATIFSAISILSLVYFYFMEKRRAKRAS